MGNRTDQERYRKARRAGWDARRYGHPRQDNPHTERHLYVRRYWFEGWDQAQQQIQAGELKPVISAEVE